MSKFEQPKLDLNPKVNDEIRKTTCYMCACRCGINVHMQSGKVKYIEGNKDHPVNQGVLCAKGSAGIMQIYSPARLRAPMKRIGPRGSGAFEEISWEEALGIATDWLQPVRDNDPKKMAFFTGRDQSQSFTSWWAQAYGTPNYAAHGGFCSVNMAAAGIYTMGGAFWEFGQPDWERTKLFMIFGVAEDHDSNPIKIGLGKLKKRGAKVIGVNPIRTGYNAIADDWVGITPGTDGLFILSLIHTLMAAGKIDLEYLIRYTNAPYLIDSDPKSETFGLFLRDNAGEPLIIDRKTKKAIAWNTKGAKPDLVGSYRRGGVSHRSVFQMIAERYLSEDYSPEAVSNKVGISADRIKGIASELARVAFEEEIVIEQEWTDFRGEKHDKMVGRPVSFHAMRGVSAHSNGFQTCRSLHLLQIILGSVEVPGGFRFKPPYPKHSTSHPKPHCKVTAGKPLDGPHLGYIQGPEDLCINNDGKPIRIDKAYSWENPMSAHGLMHMVISNAYSGDPYPIDVMFMYMANMSWNSSMNTSGVMEMLTAKDEKNEYKIPKLIYSDAYSSEMVAYADLILPDTTYMERHDCISLLDRPICEAEAAADSIRWPVIEPDRDVRGFQSVLLDLGARLKLPGFITENGEPKFKNYADYIVNHQRRPGVGPLAGFRGKNGDKEGRGEPNPKQIQAYIENGGFWKKNIPEAAQFFKPWNVEYQEWAVETGLFDKQSPYLFDIYIEPMQKFVLSAKGIGEMQPPDHLRKQIIDTMDPLPIWYKPFEEQVTDGEEFPVHALTQRPMAMYHSWGSQNAWLRQIHGYNPMYLPKKIWKENNFQEGDWALITSRSGSIKVPVSRMDALNENTIWTWNAIGKRRGAWGLSTNAAESNKGFLLNHIIHELLPPKKDGMRWSNSDPITGQAAWFDLKVRVEKISKEEHVAPFVEPQQSPVKSKINDVKYGEDFVD